MANTIATPSFATPSQWTTDTKVAIASDGTAFVLWCDGTNIKYSIASSPYSSWTTSTLSSSVGGATRWAGSVYWDSATDNLMVVSTEGGNTATLLATPFTKSGANWTPGTSHTIDTGVVPYQGSAIQILKDGQGRYWAAVQPGTANTYVYVYVSTNGGTTWTQSVQSNQNLSGAIIPAMAIVGNYLTLVWGDANISWQRLDVSGVSLGAWSAVFTDGTNFVDNVTNSTAFFPFSSGSKGMFAWTYSGGGGPGTFASVYDPVGNTFSAKSTIQTGTNQGQCTLMPLGADIYALYTIYSAANNYSLAYKKYTDGTSTWDTSPTTIEAAGANIQWPNGVISGTKAYYVYTTGTASPYTLNFNSASVVSITTNTRTVALTAALAKSRFVGATVALESTDVTRTITLTGSLSFDRIISTVDVALLATNTRPINDTVALESTDLSRLVTSTVTLTNTTFSTRTVATTVALQLSNIQRTVGTNTVSLNNTLTRTVGTNSVAFIASLTRPVTDDTALSLADITRTVATTVSLIGPSIQRTVPATLSAGGPPTRTMATTVALFGTQTRTAATTTALSAVLTRSASSVSVALISTLTRTVAATTSLIDPTTVTPLYGTNVAGTTLTASDQLVTTGGGSSTVYTTGNQTFNFTGWMELTPTGGTANVHGAIGTPDGHGWFLDDKSYENVVIPASSNWYAWLTLHCDTAQAGTITFRAYRMHWDAPTITATYPQQIFSYTTPTINFVAGDNIVNIPMQSSASVSFAAGAGASGDKIYVDVWYNQTGGGNATSTTSFKVASGGAGIPFLFEMDIPAIVVTTNTRTVGTNSLALISQNVTRTVATTASFSGPIVRQVATTAALSQADIARTVGLTVDLDLAVNTVPYYGTDQADQFAGGGNELSATGGGSTTTYTPGNQTFNFAGWMQLLAHGGVTGVHGAIGAPDGHGWWLDWAPAGSSPLNGQTIPAGNWSGNFVIKCDAAQTGTLTFRIYKGNWVAGTATESFPTNIITYTTGSLSLAAGDNTVAVPATAAAAVTFGATDSLYVDIWYNQTGGGTGASLTYVKVAQGTTGVANVFEIDAPSNLQTHTHQIGFTAALIFSPTRTVAATAALISTLTRSVALTISMSGISQQRTVPATLSANGTFSRTVNMSAALAKQHSIATTVAISGIPPMPIISNHLPVSSFASDTTYAATNANDTNYATIWRSATHIPSVGSPAWVAYDLSSQSPKQVLVNLMNELGGQYYQPNAALVTSLFADYTIDVNAAPSSGVAAPTTGWVTLATVTGNVWTTRTHYVDMTGYNWIRVNVTASTGPAPNNDVNFQMDVHDASRGQRDTWLFLGDSITAEGSGHHNITGTEWGYGGSINQKVFAMTEGRYNPATIDGGWGGQTMTGAATNISNLDVNFTGGFVEISFGTNDCNQPFNFSPGDANVQAVYNSLLSIIDQFVLLPQSPTIVVPYIPWGPNNGGSLGFNANLVNQYVDAHLPTDRPQVFRGPDFWTFFNNNPTLIRNDSGTQIHPTYTEVNGQPSGYEWWQKLWVNWMATNFYGSPVHPIAFTASFATTNLRQIAQVQVSLQPVRLVAITASILQTTFVRQVSTTVAIENTAATRTIAATAALQSLGLQRTVPLTVAAVLTFTHTVAAAVALQGPGLRQITSDTVAFFGTPTRSVSAIVAILGFTTNTHTVPATVATLLPDNLRQVSTNSVAFIASSTRQVATTVSLSGIPARSLSITAALKTLDNPRFVSATLATLLIQSRTAGTNNVALQSVNLRRQIPSVLVGLIFTLTRTVGTNSVALQFGAQRSVIPNVALVSLGLTRTVATSTNFTRVGTRTVATDTALFGTQTRMVAATVALFGTATNNRNITPMTAAFSQANITRSVGATVVLGQLDQLRTVGPTSAALYSTFTHTIATTVSLVLTQSRSVDTNSVAFISTTTRQCIPNVPLSQADIQRSVSTTVALGTFNILHTVGINTVAISGFATHRLGTDVALVVTFDHQIAANTALLTTATRTAGPNSAALAPPIRTIAATVALMTTATRTVATTAALGADIAEDVFTILMPGVPYYTTVANVFGP